MIAQRRNGRGETGLTGAGFGMTDQAVPAEVCLSVGEEERFALPNHGAGGYSWTVLVSGDCVTASMAYDEPGQAPAFGERSSQVLHVRGVHRGEGALALEERRSWEQGSPAAAFTVRVVVQDSGEGQR
jgi:predicted secreted protein